MSERIDHKAIKGRGVASNPANRYAPVAHVGEDDGWWVEEESVSLATVVVAEKVRSIITTNRSPDIPFDQSINPYRGCEHGCVYCYARPSHAYWDMSPGLDFESRIISKPEAPRLLRKALSAPGYVCKTINIGANTDPYQPLERRLQTTREILKVLQEFRHPFSLITTSALVLR
ncbi:MAG: radical SAM protein, partial [Pseudomonadales bacterium]|nr:radical SAM protein [Pseudomonadales bacterium]